MEEQLIFIYHFYLYVTFINEWIFSMQHLIDIKLDFIMEMY